jgi:predicted metalloprotease with PDZ domain
MNRLTGDLTPDGTRVWDRLGYSLLCTSLVMLLPCVAACQTTVLDVAVDVRELPRHLIHSEIRLSAASPSLTLWFPKWVPGLHGPDGPVHNLAGLAMLSTRGEALNWRRDDEDMWRFHVDVPEGVDQVLVKLDYICNQATTNSLGADSHGNSQVGIVNWNTCLMYPEGPTMDEIQVALRVKLPKAWQAATALRMESRRQGWLHFKTASLTEIVDSPLICGEHFRSIPLDSGPYPPAFLHVTSESARALHDIDELVDEYGRLVQEAGALFGSTPYDEYHFLLCLSDQIGNLGLEHLRCSLNGMGTRSLFDPAKRRGWIAELLPHEYAHSWCGKYRRPREMCTRDFHSPQHTRLLWVYEGLTTYLAEVLTARCGLHSFEQYKDHLNQTVSRLRTQRGRRWRTLEDTAVASSALRAGSPRWGQLRRGQDYYHEGMLYWLEADAIIRTETDGKKSLDDFCRGFFARPPGPAAVIPYEIDEVYTTLAGVLPWDWQRFFEDRVRQRHEQLPLEVISRCGYRLEYAPQPSDYAQEREQQEGSVNLLDSLGLVVGGDGGVRDVVPDSPADKAGIAPQSSIQGVNGFRFSAERLKDALNHSITSGRIELLTLDGDRYRTRHIEYSDGPRYLRLVRDPGKPDLLQAITQPQSPSAAKPSEGTQP